MSSALVWISHVDAVSPTITAVSSVNVDKDKRTIQVVFSEPVVMSEAVTVTNYSLTGGLVVQAVTWVNATCYWITVTTDIADATSYTLTVSGIHDLRGNLI